MDKWVLYAFASMVFAGFTSVIAKLGLIGISGDLGLAIRTCFVFVFVVSFAGAAVALIDKGSVVVALLLSRWLLHEAMTPAKLIGGDLISLGLVVVSRG